MYADEVKLYTEAEFRAMTRVRANHLALLIGFKQPIPRAPEPNEKVGRPAKHVTARRVGYNKRLANWYKQYKEHYNHLNRTGKLDTIIEWYENNPKKGYYT